MAKDFKVTVRFEFNGNLKDVDIYTSEVKELMRRASYKNASNYLSMLKTFMEECFDEAKEFAKEYDEDVEDVLGIFTTFDHSARFYDFVDNNDYDYLASCVLLGTPVIKEDGGWSVEDVYNVMTSKDRSLKAALKHAMSYADYEIYEKYREELEEELEDEE